MMLMMLAKGASIISIIGGPFLHFGPPSRPMASPCIRIFLCRTPGPLLGLLLKTVLAHDAELEGFGDPKNRSKIPPWPAVSRFLRVRSLAWSWSRAGRPPWRNGGPMMLGQGGSAASAPPRIEVNL